MYPITALAANTKNLCATRRLAYVQGNLGATELQNLPCRVLTKEAAEVLVGMLLFLHRCFQNLSTRLPLKTLQPEKETKQTPSTKHGGDVDSKKSAATMQRILYEKYGEGQVPDT